MDKSKVKELISEIDVLSSEERAYLLKKLMKKVQQDARYLTSYVRRLKIKQEWADDKIQELTAQIPCRVLTDAERANIEKFRVTAMGIVEKCENPRKAVKSDD